jgi:dUTPase
MSKTVIEWSRLPNCPDNQLIQGSDSTDAGYDIRIASDWIVKSYGDLKRLGRFEWEFVGPVETLDLPELHHSDSYDSMMTGSEGYKHFNKVCVRGLPDLLRVINNHLSSSILVSSGEDEYLVLDKSEHKAIVLDIIFKNSFPTDSAGFTSEGFIYRVKYKPDLIPTGIRLSPKSLLWNMVTLRSGMIKYGISLAHSIGVVDYNYRNELFVPAYCLHGSALFRRGERIAQLIPMHQYGEIEFVQVEEVDTHERMGFGSTGL